MASDLKKKPNFAEKREKPFCKNQESRECISKTVDERKKERYNRISSV